MALSISQVIELCIAHTQSMRQLMDDGDRYLLPQLFGGGADLFEGFLK